MFQIDLWALAFVFAVLAAFFFFWRWKLKGENPRFLYSRLANFASKEVGKRIPVARWGRALFLLALVFFLFAFLNPRWMSSPGEHNEKPLYISGRAVYLVVDISGSMNTPVVTKNEKSQKGFPTRLDILKDVTSRFIKKSSGDLIGLISFARAAWVLVPLTLDHKIVNQKLQNLQVVKNYDRNGTAIGYAIYKTASIIAASKKFSEKQKAYDIKGSAMVLVTDGFQSPNPQDQGNRLRTMGVEEAAAFAKKQGVRLYIIDIYPKINKSEYAPERNLMEKAAKETGGNFYPAADTGKLDEIYSSINQLEESQVPLATESLKRVLVVSASFYPLFIGLGLAALIAAIIMETAIIRKVP